MYRQLAALTATTLLGLVFLCMAIGFSIFVPISHTIQCVKTTQTCEFKNIYVLPKNERQLFDFADIVNIQNVNWGEGRGGHKLYALQIDLERVMGFQTIQDNRFSQKQSIPYKVKFGIFMPMPSGYLADKEVAKFKAYLKEQKQEEFVIQPQLPISAFVFLIACLFCAVFLLSLPFLKKRPADIH